MKNVGIVKISMLALCLALCIFMLSACGGSPSAPAAPTAPTAPTIATDDAPVDGATEAPATGDAPATGEVVANEWPTDEAIAYCPKFDGTPTKVSKQAGVQKKLYIISFDGVTQEQYDAYAKTMEDDAGVTILTNFNTRNTSYALSAHKADDEKMEIRITYTKPTEKMQVSVSYAKE